MITVYHNARCSKSRAAIALLEERSVPFSVRYYMEEPLKLTELRGLLRLLGKKPSELLRRGEAIYKELAREPHTEQEWLRLMVRHPQLIERPIVVNGDRAIVARPPETVLDIC